MLQKIEAKKENLREKKKTVWMSDFILLYKRDSTSLSNNLTVKQQLTVTFKHPTHIGLLQVDTKRGWMVPRAKYQQEHNSPSATNFNSNISQQHKQINTDYSEINKRGVISVLKDQSQFKIFSRKSLKSDKHFTVICRDNITAKVWLIHLISFIGKTSASHLWTWNQCFISSAFVSNQTDLNKCIFTSNTLQQENYLLISKDDD